MKKESMRKYSLLGLILIGASAVTAAFTTANDDKKTDNGVIVFTDNGDRSCTEGAGNVCTVTVEDDDASDTTTGLEGTSDITRGLDSVITSTEVKNGTGDDHNSVISTSRDDD